ncbi:glycoside hydrolase family 5 protein [Sphingomonas sp. So64.6b]|uniref:glycoside hydrolase family 5 protein n=1 Tax=Sphingomonas sp. So64.6b TaxID=2997354 RepID=UPI001600BCCB|nr:cellulase family glycosylhydrolase [Sphingomonas sp. So64.6b]QNA86597.1 glycoside hydrolase family 5 protein [Sphingomonas sp. So64.6b]
MLDIRGTRFVDRDGRHVLLRGVNLGGDCKLPSSVPGTHLPDDFADHRVVSFVGRPFPLDQADAHLARLAHWGFNTLRLLTSWEAVSHAGPGLHDEAYLDYLRAVCRKAAAHGFFVFIDFHQDVWSRMTGGDGAPGWTFEAVGLDFTRFAAADAVHLMQARYDARLGGRQASYPQMSWSSNYRLPANAIMWTLFFGGRTYLPDFAPDGRQVQDLLQGDYLDAMRAVAQRVADIPDVIGFDTLNEPDTGLIGRPLAYRHIERSAAHPEPIRPGWAMSPLDMLLIADGKAREIPMLARTGNGFEVALAGHRTANPDAVRLWRDGVACPFAMAGLYDGDTALRPDHFTHVQGDAVDPERDHVLPFFHAVADTVRSVRADWLIFAEVNPYRAFAGNGFPDGMPDRCVNASHWYDLAALVTKRFDARRAAQYPAELAVIKRIGDKLGGPTLIGEFGLPMDLDEGRAFADWAAGDHGSGPWQDHVTALGAMYDALDAHLLSATQWNYTATNRNDAAVGDGWNQEDLSIFSADQATGGGDPDSGGRAVAGFARPYARAVQGVIATQRFAADTGVFTLGFEADTAIVALTEIVLPSVHFPLGATVSADGCERMPDSPTGLLMLRALRNGAMEVRVTAIRA